MNTLYPIHSLLAVTALSMTLLAGSASTAIATERKPIHTGTNHVGHRDAMRNRQSGTVTSHTTRTGPHGEVTTRDTTETVNQEAGTWSRHTTTTGPDGKTRSLNAEVVKTDHGYQRDVTRIDADGRQSSTSTQLIRTDTGSERHTVFTGPNGHSRNMVTTRTFTPAP